MDQRNNSNNQTRLPSSNLEKIISNARRSSLLEIWSSDSKVQLFRGAYSAFARLRGQVAKQYGATCYAKAVENSGAMDSMDPTVESPSDIVARLRRMVREEVSLTD